jgi:hypothetical protein
MPLAFQQMKFRFVIMENRIVVLTLTCFIYFKKYIIIEIILTTTNFIYLCQYLSF